MKDGRKAGGSKKGDGKNKGKSGTGAGCFNSGHLKCAQSDDSGDLEPVLRRWLNGTTTSSGLNDCITITMANSATTAMRCMRLGMRIHGMTNRCLRRDTVFVWSSMPHRRRRRHHLLLLLEGGLGVRRAVVVTATGEDDTAIRCRHAGHRSFSLCGPWDPKEQFRAWFSAVVRKEIYVNSQASTDHGFALDPMEGLGHFTELP